MSNESVSPVFDAFLDLWATADLGRVLSFRLTPEAQERLDLLLERNRGGVLSNAERAELDEWSELEHLGRMLKARARRSGEI